MASFRKIVVLGANSFSGQDFVDLCLDDDQIQLLGVSRSAERSELFLRYRTRSNLSAYRYVQLDMNRQMPELLSLLDAERPQAIVNFAAQSEVAPSWEHPEHWFQTNTVSLARLVNHLRKQDYLERYLHVSSPEVYGNCQGVVTETAPVNPSTPYAASKAAADHLLAAYQKQFNFPLVTVRATNVYGARQQLFKIIPRAIIYAKLGRKLPLHGGGAAVKSYISIRDVSRGEFEILQHGKPGEIYHLSPSAGIAVRDVVNTIAERLGKSLHDIATVVEERPGQDAAYVIDSSKARTEFGWRPRIDFNTGVDETVRWVEQYWEQIVSQSLEYQHQV